MYFLYISPAITEVQVLSDQKAEYNDVLNKANEIKEKRDTISSTYNNISSSDLERLGKIVPAKFNSVLFAKDVNDLASKNGVTIKSFKETVARANNSGDITLESESMPYIETIITLSLAGQYRQFMNFLAELETNIQLMDVISLSINSNAGQKVVESQSQYTLELKTYSLR